MGLVDVAVSRREEDFFVLIELFRPSLVCSNSKNSATTNSKKYLCRWVEVPNNVIFWPILFIFLACSNK